MSVDYGFPSQQPKDPMESYVDLHLEKAQHARRLSNIFLCVNLLSIVFEIGFDIYGSLTPTLEELYDVVWILSFAGMCWYMAEGLGHIRRVRGFIDGMRAIVEENTRRLEKHLSEQAQK